MFDYKYHQYHEVKLVKSVIYTSLNLNKTIKMAASKYVNPTKGFRFRTMNEPELTWYQSRENFFRSKPNLFLKQNTYYNT